MYYGLWITDYGLQIMDYRLWITDYGLRIMDYRLWITDSDGCTASNTCVRRYFVPYMVKIEDSFRGDINIVGPFRITQHISRFLEITAYLYFWIRCTFW